MHDVLLRVKCFVLTRYGRQYCIVGGQNCSSSTIKMNDGWQTLFHRFVCGVRVAFVTLLRYIFGEMLYKVLRSVLFVPDRSVSSAILRGSHRGKGLDLVGFHSSGIHQRSQTRTFTGTLLNTVNSLP